MKEWKHKCLRSVLVYRPFALRPDCITIGFVLIDTSGDNRRRSVRFAPDLSILNAVAPDVDPEIVEASLLELEPDLLSILGDITDAGLFPSFFPDSFPPEIEVLPASPILTNDYDNELEIQSKQLFQFSALEQAEYANTERLHGRPYLRKQIRKEFVAYQVWDHLEKQIRVDRFTLKEDSLKIDCAYTDPRSDTYRMFDAVSLLSSIDRAKILALSWSKIAEGIQKERGTQCEMIAIVENGIDRTQRDQKLAWNWLEEVGIRVSPVSAMSALAADAKLALRL